MECPQLQGPEERKKKQPYSCFLFLPLLIRRRFFALSNEQPFGVLFLFSFPFFPRFPKFFFFHGFGSWRCSSSFYGIADCLWQTYWVVDSVISCDAIIYVWWVVGNISNGRVFSFISIFFCWLILISPHYIERTKVWEYNICHYGGLLVGIGVLVWP